MGQCHNWVVVVILELASAGSWVHITNPVQPLSISSGSRLGINASPWINTVVPRVSVNSYHSIDYTLYERLIAVFPLES